jgi:exodeoxyribonuclease (lambda-induced)
MEVHFGIEQKSVEWFDIKHGKVGGTRAKELFIKSDTLFFKLLAEHVEPFDEDTMEEGYQSEAMERGNEYEPQALLELSKYSGFNFLPCGWIQSDNEILGISPDGITADFKVMAEVKCPQPIAHLKMVVADEIPLEYINQCVHSFTVNDKLETLYFCSYRPECSIKPLFVKTLTRESLVNNGTKAKPVMVSVNDLVTQSIAEAEVLQKQIKETINQLNF